MRDFILQFLSVLFGGRYVPLLGILNKFPVDKKEQALESLKKRRVRGDITEAEYQHFKRKIENS